MSGGCSWTRNWLQFDNSYYLRIFEELQFLNKQQLQSKQHEKLNTNLFINNNKNNNNNNKNSNKKNNLNNTDIKSNNNNNNDNNNNNNNNDNNDNNNNNNNNSNEKEELLWLPTDQALFDSPEFRPYFIRYATDCNIFYNDYKKAHTKMSELGAKFKYCVRLNTEDYDIDLDEKKNVKKNWIFY
jgi:catalase (peroxidase I)